MKKTLLTGSSEQPSLSQIKMSVEARLAKARAAKAAKRLNSRRTSPTRLKLMRLGRQQPSFKVVRGPNQQPIHTGERGGAFYINKNGHRTYLKSNQ